MLVVHKGFFHTLNQDVKGQLISKANCQAVNSSKKRTNEFVFTTMRRVFVRFLEEIEDTKKTFRNYLTFRRKQENSDGSNRIAREGKQMQTFPPNIITSAFVSDL